MLASCPAGRVNHTWPASGNPLDSSRKTNALACADAGYQGTRVAAASSIRVEIIRKIEGQVGFAVHARNWVVERFFAWINRNRRLAKDVEATISSAEAFLYAASAIIILRKLAR